MPTILTSGPYRIYFYSHEPNEPPHVHVDRISVVLTKKPEKLAVGHTVLTALRLQLAHLGAEVVGRQLVSNRSHPAADDSIRSPT